MLWALKPNIILGQAKSSKGQYTKCPTEVYIQARLTQKHRNL